MVIKPSGVAYEELTPDKLVVLDLDGRKVEGGLNPSSDTKTHLELYKAYPQLGGIVHTHSTYAVAFAQARRDLPAFGTTHADYFYGPVPCTRELTPEEIDEDYERNTGKVILEDLRPARHRPGASARRAVRQPRAVYLGRKDAAEAVYHAAVLEEVAKMAVLTLTIDPARPACAPTCIGQAIPRASTDPMRIMDKKNKAYRSWPMLALRARGRPCNNHNNIVNKGRNRYHEIFY